MVTAVYERFVRPSDHKFRSKCNAQFHHNLVRFNPERTRAGTGEVIDTGIDRLFIKAAEYYFHFKWDGDD